MTEKRSMTRPRRRTGATSIPAQIKRWFSGECQFTFYAHTLPHIARLGDYWLSWKADHHDAVPPQTLNSLIESGRCITRMKELTHD